MQDRFKRLSPDPAVSVLVTVRGAETPVGNAALPLWNARPATECIDSDGILTDAPTRCRSASSVAIQGALPASPLRSRANRSLPRDTHTDSEWMAPRQCPDATIPQVPLAPVCAERLEFGHETVITSRVHVLSRDHP